MSLDPTDDRPASRGGLTTLDKRILDALPEDGRSVRLPALVAKLANADTDEGEVRGILRGFEHLGKVQNRRGWWRRLDFERTERNA